MKIKLISPPKGVYPPIITPFTPLEDLNLDELYNHVVHLIKAGCAGIVVMGSTGEAVMLTDDERIQVIKTARKAIDIVNPNAALIAGTGSQSTIHTIKLTNDAANAGADFAIILTPSYFASSMTPDAIESFFNNVADVSIIPILIYNYPAVISGKNLFQTRSTFKDTWM